MFEQSAIRQRLALTLRQKWNFLQTHRWQSLIGLLCFGLINGYIGYRVYREWDQLAQLSELRINGSLLLFTAALQFIGVLIPIGGWMLMLRQLGYRASFRQHFRIYTVSNLARKMPGVGWNIVSRVYMYQQRGGDKTQISIISVAEMVIFGIAAAITALATMPLSGNHSSQIVPPLLIGSVLVFGALLSTPWFKRLLRWLSKSEGDVQLRSTHLLAWAVLNTSTIALGGVALFLFCRAFGVVDNLALLPLSQGWALTVIAGSLLFWIPSVFDVTSSFLILVLSTAMPAPQALLLLVAWRLWCTANEVVWGAIGFSLQQ